MANETSVLAIPNTRIKLRGINSSAGSPVFFTFERALHAIREKQNTPPVPLFLLNKIPLADRMPVLYKHTPAFSGTLLGYAKPGSPLGKTMSVISSSSQIILDGIPPFANVDAYCGFVNLHFYQSIRLAISINPFVMNERGIELDSSGNVKWQYEIEFDESKRRIVFTIASDAHVVVQPLFHALGEAHSVSGLPWKPAVNKSNERTVSLSAEPNTAFVGLPIVILKADNTLEIEATHESNSLSSCLMLAEPTAKE
ncbi:MAG: hypothetical protein ABIH99_00440 [Candidatus Micrarchaeota archaeon]